LHAETTLLSGAKMRNKLLHHSHLIVKRLLILSGIFLVWTFLFAFTTGPFYWYHYFGTGNSDYDFKPEVVIILGGTPMPSESALIRCYYARELARKNPDAQIIISQLKDANQTLTSTAAWKMRDEISRGEKDTFNFAFLTDGHSTREEVMLLKKRFPGIGGKNCVVVSSPEHMLRAVAAFRRAGYRHVGGEPTFGWAGNADYRYKDRKLGGRQLPLEIGNNVQMRYQFWNHLRYQLLCYREFIAFFWYRLRGWA
jgi:uncharacterized SAM-binding protein YcdF (DUF218 family)